MQSAPRIRRAEEEDALELALLAERTFRSAFESSNTAANMERHCAASYGEALQLVEICESGRETWVVEVDHRLVAYTQLRLDALSSEISGRRPIEVQRFYVDAAHQGTGLANQLMAHALARAEIRRSDVLWLGVWEHNARAQAFYRRWGFEVVGEQIFPVGDDPQRDLVMRLRTAIEQP